jgi:hypothetical protein
MSNQSFTADIDHRNNKALLVQQIYGRVIQVSKTFLFLLITVESASAFDAKRHSIYTLDAVQAFSDCKGINLSLDAGAALAAGTEAEDTSLLTLDERVTNWHFYNRDYKLRPGWFGSRNLDGIFAKRIMTLEEQLTSEKSNPVEVYEYAGRVLHYIQDMSVPAHVVPVFHVKLPLLDLSDPFDDFKRREGLPPFQLTPAQCETLRAEVVANKTYPTTLLNNAAKDTLWIIGQTKSPNAPQTSWVKYWHYPAQQQSDAYKGWGDYGVCAFTRGSTVAGCKSDAELDALFEHQYQQTLINSVRMLFYINERLNNKKTASTRKTKNAVGATCDL